MNKLYFVVFIGAILLSSIGLVYYATQNEPDKVLIEVTSQQFRFDPHQINVTLGVELTLRITSLDVTHGFQLEEFGVYNVVVPSGQTVDVTFLANKVGTFRFYCTVICGTGHANHLGYLNVMK